MYVLQKQTIKAAVYSETVDFSMRSSSVHTLSSLPWLFAKVRGVALIVVTVQCHCNILFFLNN